MALFGKKDEEASESLPAPPSSAPAPAVARPARAATPKRSFLGPGCELEGTFRGGGSFECSGTVTGTVEVEGDVVIGRGGTAAAQLSARRIVIEGRLEGNATGSEKVEVGASGHVEGDVRAPAVQFAEGAFFEGNVEMRRAKQQAEPAPSVPGQVASTAASTEEPRQR